jgi:hypothetical protein
MANPSLFVAHLSEPDAWPLRDSCAGPPQIRDPVIPVTSAKHGFVQGWAVEWRVQVMKKLLVLGALGIFLAAHGAVTAMTIYPQLDAYSCDGSSC